LNRTERLLEHPNERAFPRRTGAAGAFRRRSKTRVRPPRGRSRSELQLSEPTSCGPATNIGVIAPEVSRPARALLRSGGSCNVRVAEARTPGVEVATRRPGLLLADRLRSRGPGSRQRLSGVSLPQTMPRFQRHEVQTAGAGGSGGWKAHSPHLRGGSGRFCRLPSVTVQALGVGLGRALVVLYRAEARGLTRPTSPRVCATDGFL
jgi:hypothetical protein